MEQFFASLSKRHSMLLLTAVTFGGSDCAEVLEHLPPDDAELLKHRAVELLEIPKEKRIPLLVQEIKRLVLHRRRLLSSAEPERVAELLGNERAATQEVVLRALPASIADGVRKALPVRQVKLRREVKAEVLDVVRWKLEEALTRRLPASGMFKFADLLLLQGREFATVCDRMGARALATAIAGVSPEERTAFLEALPPDQRTLARRTAEAGASRRLSEEDAKATLDLYDARRNPSLGLRSAGVQRLARACLAQSPEFAMRVLERQGGELGKLLARWLRDERARPSRGDGGRADILEQVERLAQKGVIDRPLRLPPPPPLRPAPAAGLPGGRLLAPSLRHGPTKAPGALSPPPARQRDPIAEREARKAGVVSAFPRVPLLGPPREASDDEPTAHTASRGAPKDRVRSAPVSTEPRGPKGQRSSGTLFARTPTPSGSRPKPKGPKRGPRGGSG